MFNCFKKDERPINITIVNQNTNSNSTKSSSNLNLQDISNKIDKLKKQYHEQMQKEFTGKYGSEYQPKIGDHVLCHHFKWAFYFATVVNYDTETMRYTVNWDDNDSTGRSTDYQYVVVDKTPLNKDLAIGTEVLFEQGNYRLNLEDGNVTTGFRWHLGVIDKVESVNGEILYSGHHLKGEADGKWVTFKAFEYRFENYSARRLRVFPNVIDNCK